MENCSLLIGAIPEFNPHMRASHAPSTPNRLQYADLIRHCGNHKAFMRGKTLHMHLLANKLERDRYLANLLIEMYGKCSALESACTVFCALHQPNLFSFNLMLAAYGRCGDLEGARGLFDNMVWRDLISWNAMLAAYAQNGQGMDAIILFQKMQQQGLSLDKFSFGAVLDACAGERSITQGRKIHTFILLTGFEVDVSLGTALINFYGKCGCIQEAKIIFDTLPNHNIVSWTAMIVGFVQNGFGNEALKLFQHMQMLGETPDMFTYSAVLDACACVVDLDAGRRTHNHILHEGLGLNIAIGNALIHMYGKCGSIKDARAVFDAMPQRDVISWTSILTACSQGEHAKEALQLYKEMQFVETKPNKVTYVAALVACASLGALEQGKKIHNQIAYDKFEADEIIGNALIDMYGKCGSLHDAQKMFDKMLYHDVISWTAILAAYAQNGDGNNAVHLFQQMHLEGVIANKVTFLIFLSACSHGGKDNEGCHHFLSSSTEYTLASSPELQRCVLDLLGRVGKLDEAEDIIRSMPFEPVVISWITLLAASKVHGDLQRGQRIAEYVHRLDPENAASYLLLANIYALVEYKDWSEGLGSIVFD